MSISGEESDEDYCYSDADLYYDSYSSDEDTINNEEYTNAYLDDNEILRNDICPISYIVLKTYFSKCNTCKYCFDCDAIALWFIKSNNKLCPMCRSLWK